MWYTERRYRHPTDSRKERHNEEERVFGRRGFAEYQLGVVPEDHEKSGRKAEKREKAEIVQTAPFGCAEGGSGCRKSLSLRASSQTGSQSVIYAGGARGGKARLESDQMSRKALPCKACVARSDYFRAARRHKNNDIISGCRKKPEAFSTAWKGRRKPSFCCM